LLRVIASCLRLSARRASLRRVMGLALILCVGASLAAASSFHESEAAAPAPLVARQSVQPEPADSAGPPTVEPWHPVAAAAPDVTNPPPLATCTTVIVSWCDTPPPPMALAAVPSAGRAFTLRVPILEYHRVKPLAGESGSAESLIVPPEVFSAQMDALSTAGWQTITMGQLGDDLRLAVQPPPKTFVVTLDDGYEDGYQYAFPILSRHGFVATFFVIAGQIGEGWQLSPAQMRELIAAGNEIGNHSMSHTNMMVMTPERLTMETYGASAAIASQVGIWPKSFSYPMGLTYAPSTAAVGATPGILTAVIQGGSERETWANRLAIPRVRVGPGTYPQDLVDRLSRYVS